MAEWESVPQEWVPRFRKLFQKLASGEAAVRFTKLEQSHKVQRLLRAAGVEGPLLHTRASRRLRLLVTRESDGLHLVGFRDRSDATMYQRYKD
jgi:hypothetical protein